MEGTGSVLHSWRIVASICAPTSSLSVCPSYLISQRARCTSRCFAVTELQSNVYTSAPVCVAPIPR
ncbi:hypothetical protein BU26DRAFT_521296 [Trematosphaeria pertusa]|uniref:Uncharacterized protein n=1 Tax=Trematosphaeria pertusa TaxID=390896 RepID=A0A6A6I957_9PLEO|nr:uncharacterized protein BU26DRAFT_521296 [Trematosphaeria pertusa]KAF2246906.1 hypothetical protein BU26DRAFT_521296 [Trematosphaeria pertusa]